MKIDSITDYDFVNKTHDLANNFNVIEKTNPNGSVDTFYNLNEGVVIEGIDELPQDSIISYTCKNNDDLRFISHDLYGRTDFWWILAKLNGITDCTETLAAGRKLKTLRLPLMNRIYGMVKESL